MQSRFAGTKSNAQSLGRRANGVSVICTARILFLFLDTLVPIWLGIRVRGPVNNFQYFDHGVLHACSLIGKTIFRFHSQYSLIPLLPSINMGASHKLETGEQAGSMAPPPYSLVDDRALVEELGNVQSMLGF